MQTRLIQIISDTQPGEEEEGWAEWATRGVKENGWKVAGAAIIATPVLPAAMGSIAVGAGLVSGVQNGVAWLNGSDEIRKIPLSEAKELRDEHDLPLQVDEYYALHPDESRQNVVILASDFHNVIVGEQIADLVTFIRGSVCAREIRIEVESERSGKLGGSFLSRFSLKAGGGVTKHHSVELSYDDPEVVPMHSEPYWLHLFPEIITAFRGAKKGSIKRSVSVDTTFGLKSSVASKAGIDGDWLGRQKFIVHAQFI